MPSADILEPRDESFTTCSVIISPYKLDGFTNVPPSRSCSDAQGVTDPARSTLCSISGIVHPGLRPLATHPCPLRGRNKARRSRPPCPQYIFLQPHDKYFATFSVIMISPYKLHGHTNIPPSSRCSRTMRPRALTPCGSIQQIPMRDNPTSNQGLKLAAAIWAIRRSRDASSQAFHLWDAETHLRQQSHLLLLQSKTSTSAHAGCPSTSDPAQGIRPAHEPHSRDPACKYAYRRCGESRAPTKPEC